MFLAILEINETTFAGQQKHYWRKYLTENVNVLDIGVSELFNPISLT